MSQVKERRSFSAVVAPEILTDVNCCSPLSADAKPPQPASAAEVLGVPRPEVVSTANTYAPTHAVSACARRIALEQLR